MIFNLKKGEAALFIFNFIALLVFTIIFLGRQNYEFIIYIGTMVFFFVLIAVTLRKSEFDYIILGGLTIWGLLHMLGGSVIVNGHVLYAWKIITLVDSGNIFILKYDQVVHFFGFFVATLVGNHLLQPYLTKETNYKVVYTLLVFIGIGMGALNEMIEFIAVVLLPQTGVGGYFNTSLDLVFNTLGSIAAVAFIHYRRGKEELD